MANNSAPKSGRAVAAGAAEGEHLYTPGTKSFRNAKVLSESAEARSKAAMDNANSVDRRVEVLGDKFAGTKCPMDPVGASKGKAGYTVESRVLQSNVAELAVEYRRHSVAGAAARSTRKGEHPHTGYNKILQNRHHNHNNTRSTP